MPLFLACYIAISVAVVITVFFLSYNEKKSSKIKTVLTVIYILTIVGIVFAMGCLEARYGFSKLVSSCIAAAVIGSMYLADTLGTKFANKKED